MASRRAIAVSIVLATLALTAAYLFSNDSRFLPLAWNSLFLAIGTCAIALPLGTMLGAAIWKTSLFGKQAAAWIVVALIFLPLYLHYAGWDAGLGARGWITAAVGRPLAEPILFGWRGAILIHGIAATPWVAVIVALGLAGVEPTLEQVALQDSHPLIVFFRVTLPRSWQSLVVAAMWITITAIGEIQITDMFQVRTYAEVLYMGFAAGDTLSEATFSQLGQMLLIGSSVTLAFAVVAYFSPNLERTDDRSPTVFSWGPFGWLGSAVTWFLLLAMLAFPLINLVSQAGIDLVEVDGKVTQSWSLPKAVLLIPAVASEYSAELGWSFAMAAAAATVGILIAVPLGWFARRSIVARSILIVLAAVLVAIPGPLVGIGLIKLFNNPAIPGLPWLYSHSIAAPVAAMIIRSLPLLLLIIWRTMSRVGSDQAESAVLEGASAGQQMGLIGIAGQLPALAAAWLLGVAVSMGELAASKMTMPPGVETVTVRIFGLAHAGVDDQLAGLCLLAELIFLAMAALVYGALRK